MKKNYFMKAVDQTSVDVQKGIMSILRRF